MYIWPNMQVVLGLRPGDADAKARARARVILFARLNLDPRRAGRRSPWWRRRTSTDVAERARSPTAAADAVAAAARAGEPDRYLAALLAPPPPAPTCWRWRHSPARLPACRYIVTRRAGHGRDPPAMVARCAAAARRPSRAPATRSPMPCAPRLQRHDLPGALLLDVIDARARSTLPREVMADDAALQTYLWKSEGALFALAGRILRPGAVADDRRGRRRVRPGLRPCRGCCSACRTRCPAGGCRCRSRASSAAGVTRSELLAGERRASNVAACLRTCATRPAQALSRAGNMWRICRARRAWPSFLWPWSGPICGRWNGRAATCCAAPPRSRRSRACAGSPRRIGSAASEPWAARRAAQLEGAD